MASAFSKAFLKSAFERKFYDLGRAGYWGPQSRKKVNFHFDPTRDASGATVAPGRRLENAPLRKQETATTAAAVAAMRACGGGDEQMGDAAIAAASARACGGGTQQLDDAAAERLR